MSKNHAFVFPAILLFLVILLVVGAYQVNELFSTTPLTKQGTEVVVLIPPQSHVRQIARILHEAGVLEETWKFRLLARLTKQTRSLQPGEYAFDAPSPPYLVLEAISQGKVLLHKVTFPEGITQQDIAQILKNANFVQEDEFILLLSDPTLLKELKIPAASFEGFLFPDTYYFSRTDTGEKIIKTMVRQFHQVITTEDRKKADAFNFSLLDWVTLASIIEKESSRPEEHPIISSVFHNRLRKKMRLQSDPTVIYGLKEFDGNLTRKHLETPTPYNTYTRWGLPPGPIANPGASAIHAAVNPADTDYFYFVGDRKGRHVFSKTYEEHNRNVARYQLRKR